MHERVITFKILDAAVGSPGKCATPPVTEPVAADAEKGRSAETRVGAERRAGTRIQDGYATAVLTPPALV